MKLFKNIDEKLEIIGFKKIREDRYGAEYEREDKEFNYVQKLSFYHKRNGKHLILSYEKQCNKDGFNNVIGLTGYETKLALKKMKQLGMYSF